MSSPMKAPALKNPGNHSPPYRRIPTRFPSCYMIATGRDSNLTNLSFTGCECSVIYAQAGAEMAVRLTLEEKAPIEIDRTTVRCRQV